MRYVRAQEILPAELLRELQQYVDGAYLYIPRKAENRLAWGQRTNSKAEIVHRNREIFQRAQGGESAAQLAEAYYLTEKTIRRILLEERRRGSGQ